jgi:hypothetical protein
MLDSEPIGDAIGNAVTDAITATVNDLINFPHGHGGPDCRTCYIVSLALAIADANPPTGTYTFTAPDW